jgi:hypothetical protein
MFLEIDGRGGGKNSLWYPPVQTPIFWALRQKSKLGSIFFLALVLRFPKRFIMFLQDKNSGRR